MTSLAERVAAPRDLPPLPDALTWRALTRDDVPALTALIIAGQEADGARYRISPEEVDEKFDGSWKDPVANSRVGVDADGAFRAWAWVETYPADERTVRASIEGGVHPAVRRQGIGRAVVAWLEARARQALVETGKELPARIAAYVDDDAPAAEKAVYERAGFTALRYYSNLRRDLTLPVPTAPLGAGLRLVPWSDDVDEAARLAHNDAFRDHWGSEPRSPESWAKGRATFAPAWSFTIVDDTIVDDAGPFVAGYLVSGKYEQDWPVQGYTSGYTELLGVRRSHRGRGISVALLEAAMTAYARDGMQYAELDVDTENPSGAHGLYASLGYEKVDGSRMYSIEL
ncbi:acetyltransferase (GNAT) family protein [Sediminihabitans luteus]|uniref:Acetyltransferase (GNAT) family protein n=1 Tax=Sediminihabitans luteus TaxID=1138585 RepID=A0A2M9CQ77_9CELL|nr:GNAT family N-acetyltransferase [Sediminihabitans luteus]PJJ74076.1 acetyltransferase (GNAT) family protein [Sediminihabitans luteus]GII98009.1 putative acetyltransferase, GNAT [Sediminihabitans luteus]